MANKYMFIIATASRLSSNINVLKKMVLAGSDGLRFNFSYGTIAEKIEIVKQAQEIIIELNAQTKILIDLPNAKTRLGDFNYKELYVKEGQLVTLKSAQSSDDPQVFLPVQADKIGNTFYPELTIVIDEGEIALKVINIISDDTVECIASNSGIIYPHKGLNWKGQNLSLTDHMRAVTDILPQLTAIEPNFIACPNVNNGAMAEAYKTAIEKINWNKKPKIIFKIETPEAVKNAAEILKFGDMLLLERGNLGITGPFEKLGVFQKQIIALCKEYGKPVIISTQLLESTIHNLVPQRSEISDLTNLVLDDVNGIVLCHETGVNARPAYSVAIARKIIAEAEKYKQMRELAI